MELQSGIVLAVIIGAVLLVDRIGGNDELARRLFQIALGVALAFTVLTATTAFIRASSDSSAAQLFSNSSSDNGGRDLANHLVATRSIDFGIGVLAFLFGIGGLRRWSTVPIGLAIGGLLLVLFGGTDSGSTEFRLLTQTSLAASRTVNTFNVALMALGTGAMLWFGFTTWDTEDALTQTDGDEEIEDSEEGSG